jgi:thiaminase/transcriptional activator TenA
MAAICARLREEAEGIWRTLHGHPFIRELAAGTLPPEKFRFYIEQNLLYLPEYGRAIAIGASKARDLAELGEFASALTNIVEIEIPENRRLRDRIIDLGAADMGGSLVMAPANVAYSSYLISAAYGGGPLEVMTALMPCAWSYGDIATRLESIADHPVYTEWVAFFGSSGYSDLVAEMRTQLEAMAAGASPTQQRNLSAIFQMGARLEWGFWEMGYTLAHWPDVRVARPAAVA